MTRIALTRMRLTTGANFCMHWRGVKDDDATMSNSVMRGAFMKNADLRREFLSLLRQHR